ncbi:phosphorylase [Methylocapsa palsarum]|uniref:Hopanoid-associated phosphorylase n=1 Tax=Methylocapsa palsarum TaxID=1612308 RepID=A0A1I3VQZ1_9HYPH|nr:phosphorylase [Methylocapsa palsarum]SFJ97580.1 hopanoid-associated phosphorylase [Methylocapsa palsarum]
MSDQRGLVVAVTGLKSEAGLAAGPGVLALAGGGDGAALHRDIKAAALAGARAVISFGVAGGLAPDLAPGAVLVSRSIVTESGERFLTHPLWTRRISAALGGARIADFAGVDSPVADADGKRALYLGAGAHAVDMESHIAARAASAHNLPFAAVRVIADPAGRGLPHAAIVAMKPGGGLALDALALSLLRDPRQIPHLIQTAIDARAAFRGLFRSRKALAGAFGFDDLGEFVLDVPGEDEFGGPLPL